MRPRWKIDDEVRVVRNVRDDGTFPGADVGELLVRRGSTGLVRDIGTFLQDQIIYTVFFYEENRLVGCREEELLGIDEPWVPSRYEFREKVSSLADLKVGGELLIHAGDPGEIIKVIRDHPAGLIYHVHFDTLPGRVLQIPEAMLAPLHPADQRGANHASLS
ncbi:MAG: nitrogen fixation protein NifZ [Azovibrio sp.]|uniref:nitrogen fixation protein NifZ n=1 Tax=Azovibrio sp. TaxID=1872673 RepID=UPI003C750FC5